MTDATPEMVARVADAIRNAGNGLDGDTIGTMLRENFRVEPRGDDHGEAELAIVCEAAARTAIEAMREPSRAMAIAGSAQMNRHKIIRSRIKAGSPDIYTAMIDTALTAPASEP